MKTTRFLPHALAAMARRGLEQATVQSVLDAPDEILPGSQAGRLVYQRVITIKSDGTPRLVRVIVEENDAGVVVITAYATSHVGAIKVGHEDHL